MSRRVLHFLSQDEGWRKFYLTVCSRKKGQTTQDPFAVTCKTCLADPEYLEAEKAAARQLAGENT